jgi:hypothetical protein
MLAHLEVLALQNVVFLFLVFINYLKTNVPIKLVVQLKASCFM